MPCELSQVCLVRYVHRAKAPRLELPLLLPTLRELLITQLTSDRFGAECSLKEYLGYQVRLRIVNTARRGNHPITSTSFRIRAVRGGVLALVADCAHDGWQDFDLPYTDWYTENFPETLTLAHTLATYQALSELGN
jgi:hypothetical protein